MAAGQLCHKAHPSVHDISQQDTIKEGSDALIYILVQALHLIRDRVVLLQSTHESEISGSESM